MKFTVILTSYKEAGTIKEAINHILSPNSDLKDQMELIAVAPDTETLNAAKEEASKFSGFNFLAIQDSGQGKPAALNLAAQKATGEIFILTDGDMYISDNSIRDLIRHFESEKVGGVSGHPISLDDRKTQFGYYSHLFCEAAHEQRSTDKYVPMSGYLYAFRNVKEIFPIPENIRAEDAYVSAKIAAAGFEIRYEPKALANVRFPKNFSDWIKQKKRSLGGNVQSIEIPAGLPQNKRSVFQDLENALFPLQFAKNSAEIMYSLALYPLRLYLWIAIYLQHLGGNYSSGRWERIESSKS